MARHFDLVVVGTGSAATSVAYPCRSAGWSVAIVDERPFGGTCANRGCDPKKVLVGVAGVLDSVRRMAGHGLRADRAHLDWPELMRFKRTFTDPVPSDREKAFADAGLTAFHGTARFHSPEQLEIAGEPVDADHVAICSGAAPAKLGIPGEEFLVTSDDFLELEKMPESLLFVGGGYIAFEFAHLAARAGAKVTIIHGGQRPLEQFDGTLTEMLLAETRRVGIDVRLGSRVAGLEKKGEGYTARLRDDSEVTAACAVHAAGRLPNLGHLDLEAGSVQSSSRGVVVNEFLRSPSNPRVFAAGDCADSGGPPLTPVAGYEGRIVVENLLRGDHVRTNYSGCASAVFTIPPLAAVGLTEDAARQRSLDFDVHTADSSGWYSSRRIAEECSGYKVLVERGSGRLLGAHLLGDGAEEHINVFALAIRTGLTATQVKETLFAYPTHGSNTQYML